MARLKHTPKLTPRGTRILSVEVRPEVAADLQSYAEACGISATKAAHQILADFFSLDMNTGMLLGSHETNRKAQA